MIKTPKLLPWYARRAGVPLERAAVLWKRAVCEATAKTGWVGSNQYWGEAMQSFVALLEREKSSFCAPQVTALVRSHNRIWRLPLTAMEDMLSVLWASWQRQMNHSRRAA